MTYVWIGFASAVLLVVGLAFYYGRKSGREAQDAANLKKTVSIREKQLEEANKPRDPQSIRDSLLNDNF